MTTTTPRQAVEALRSQPDLPRGDDERFAGYGVMGIPFAIGHFLAHRDMLASSVGPAFLVPHVHGQAPLVELAERSLTPTYGSDRHGAEQERESAQGDRQSDVRAGGGQLRRSDRRGVA